MFLRLCVVMSVFMVQGVLADDLTFEAQLKKFQERMPAGCQIKSPAMKVAYACSAIQSANANPRFYSTIDAGQPGSPAKSSNGVNFCYNSLVTVAKLGGIVRVQVIRDSGQSAKRQIFQVHANFLKEPDGENTLPLEDQRGLCFGYTDAVNSNCKFVFGSSDVDMAVRVSFDRSNNPTQSLTADYDSISESRRNGSQLNKSAAEVDPEDISRSVVIYARAQLLARAKRNMGPGAPVVQKFEADAYNQCDSMLANYESSLKVPIEKDPGQDLVLNEYRNRLKGVPANNATPGGAPATGITERKK